MRSDEEHEEDDAWLAVVPSRAIAFRTYSSAEGAFVERAVPSSRADDEFELVVHRVSLLDKGKFVRRLIWQLPLVKTLQALVYKLMGDEAGMRNVLIPVVNDLGLSLVYTTMLETSQRELVACFECLLSCLREEEALLVMCALGKDRTGLFSALVLAVCGVGMDDILEDYGRSDGVGEVALAGVERMESLRGLNRDMFSAAPRDAMVGAFEFLDEKYGGFSAYLDRIGFDEDRQEELRRRMTTSP